MKIVFFLLLVLASLVQAALLPVRNAQPKVSFDWKPALELTWQGIKARNIDAYPATDGLLHRPKADGSIGPGDAVSEGQGYGMMVALYAGDQSTFNRIWAASNKYMWNGNSLDWQVKPDGSKAGGGAAADADQDIAAMLIFADSLVKAGIWQSAPSGGPDYAERAQAMLNRIWGSMVHKYDGANGVEYHLRPGDGDGSGWGGYSSLNPGYYTPAFYRIYADFDSNSDHKWMLLIDQAYKTLEANPGAARGLLPDWSNGAGEVLASGPGYNAYDRGQSMFKDAIRILWRVSCDALWFNEPRAKSFLRKSMDFLATKGGAPAANFYKLDGTVIPIADTWTFNGGKTTRKRNEHSPLTIGMWATAAMAVGTAAEKEALSAEMQKYYETGKNYFGLAVDPSGAEEDTAHNEMYFDQFLAWWGVSMMAGVQSNVLYDIANPPPASTRPSKNNLAQTMKIQQSPGRLTVRVPGFQGRIEIFGIQGQRLSTLEAEGGLFVWNTTGVPSGLYLLKAGSQTRKVILP